MKRKEVEKRLRCAGWVLVRHGGRHDIWSDGESEIALPRHNEINEYTAKSILKEAEGK
jgi:mRNA interferase HicA